MPPRLMDRGSKSKSETPDKKHKQAKNTTVNRHGYINAGAKRCCRYQSPNGLAPGLEIMRGWLDTISGRLANMALPGCFVKMVDENYD